MKIIFLLLIPIATWSQVGAKASQVSPEIVKQIKQETSAGFTVTELREFKKLHDADSEMLRKIVANSKKYAELEQFVSGLDITVDTRLLTQAVGDIKELQRVQKLNDDRAREERDAQLAMIQTIKTGTIMLVIGAALTAVMGSLKFWFVDPKRRRAIAMALDEKDSARSADLIGYLQDAKAEIVRVAESAATNTAQQAAIAAAVHVAHQTADLEEKLDHLHHRVDRLGAGEGMPIT